MQVSEQTVSISRTKVGWLFLFALLLLGAAIVARKFEADREAAFRRISGKNVLVRSRAGVMELAERGQGPALLMIHGTGGGFDQGLIFAEPIIHNGIRVIAPSRCGYLRSSWPAHPSSERQADAFGICSTT
jgi:hypothetical protein